MGRPCGSQVPAATKSLAVADIDAAAFPEYMHRELDDLYIDGDVVVVQLSLNGTHQGDLPMAGGTIPATGKEFHAPCCDVFHLEDGKVSASDCYYAGTILLVQLGASGNLEAAVEQARRPPEGNDDRPALRPRSSRRRQRLRDAASRADAS